MRKIYFYLLAPFIAIGCDSTEESSSKTQSGKNPTQTYIINGDIVYEAEITDGSKPKKPIFIYNIPENNNKNDNNVTSKTAEESTSLNFNYGIAGSTKSGCKKKVYNDGNSYYTDNGVYGSIPYNYNGHLVRGYGSPYHNFYYNSLVLMTSNRGTQGTNGRGIVENRNDKKVAAISIEYPFNKNKTYEVTLTTVFYDNITIVEKKHSNGYPTLYVQLKDDGIISLPNVRNLNEDPCLGKDINEIGLYSGIGLYDNDNYTRQYKLDSHAIIQRDLKFYFSPTNEKKALLISLHPTLGIEGYNMPIPTNDYTMLLPLIKITEKPFDPSINFEVKMKDGDRGDGRR